MRFSPDLKISERFYDCTFLVSGYDTLEESASVYVLADTWKWLEAAKDNAKLKNKGDNQAYSTALGGMEFQIKPHGGDGVAFLLSNDLCSVAIRPAATQFNLSVRYSAAALWQYGPQEARRYIWAALMQEMRPRPVEAENDEADTAEDRWRRVSSAHFAFDFHSPEFSLEITPAMAARMVCHSSCKARVDFKTPDGVEGYVMGTSTKAQTLTIGKKDSLQIQIYNKSDEISEASGKTWMYRLWERAGLPPAKKHDDVWRIELRFSRQYLSQRNIDTFDDLEHNREKLLSEALATRRLCDMTGDSNRRRWPVHPMWGQALQLSGEHKTFLPLGRQIEKASDVVFQEAVRDMKAALRRASVVKRQGWDWTYVHNIINEIIVDMDRDNPEEHIAAIERYQEKYKFLDRAR